VIILLFVSMEVQGNS